MDVWSWRMYPFVQLCLYALWDFRSNISVNDILCSFSPFIVVFRCIHRSVNVIKYQIKFSFVFFFLHDLYKAQQQDTPNDEERITFRTTTNISESKAP